MPPPVAIRHMELIAVGLANTTPQGAVEDRGALAGSVRAAAMMALIHAPFAGNAGRGGLTRLDPGGQTDFLQKGGESCRWLAALRKLGGRSLQASNENK